MNDTACPLISVVIPTYNHARYLGRSLQSLLNQTFTEWEAVVIDNHSTDNTDEIMSGFTDKRIRYIKMHNNGIIAASRNAGIRAAKGDWIAFLDSDDWWRSDKLQVCFEYIHDNIDLIYHDLEIVSDHRRLFRKKAIKSWQVKRPVLIDLMVKGNAIATSSVIVRRKILMGLDCMDESPDMVASEDYNMWLRIARVSEGFKYVSKRLGFYQLHNQGMSRKDMSVPVRRAVAEYMDWLTPIQIKRFEGNICYTQGRFQYLTGNDQEAKKHFIISLKYGKALLKYKSAAMLMVIFVKSKIAFL